MNNKVVQLLEISKDISHYCSVKEYALSEESLSLTGQQICMKMLYNIILELARTGLEAIKDKHVFSSAALLRSSYEYFMQLMFVAKDVNNWKELNTLAQQEQLKLINAIERSNDPTLAKLRNEQRFSFRKVELRDELKDSCRLNLWDISKEVEHDWMYDMVYRVLSSIAHPNMVTYSNIYFKNDPTAEGLEYISYPKMNEEDILQRCILLSKILIDSTKSVFAAIASLHSSQVKKEIDAFADKLCESYYSNPE